MIERFDRAQIARFLRNNNLRFLVDQQGEFTIDFYGDDVPDYRVQIGAEGAHADILYVRIAGDVTYQESARDRIEGFVAGWNRRTFWPKAFLAEDSRGRGIRVIGETAFPLTSGVHQELLDTFIEISMVAGRHLLGELTVAASAASGTELETWLREAG